MRMDRRIYILSLLTLGMASFLLFHFGMIWVCGEFYIYESNYLVLTAETSFVVAILVFSFYCILGQIVKMKQ
jgi:hypothetical protein